MKSFSNIITGCLVTSCLLGIQACTKTAETPKAGEITDLSNKSLVQVYNATVSSGGSLVNVDNTPVNGTTALAYATAFPASSYFIADPGLRSFSIKASSSSSLQAPVSFAETLQPSTYYNVFTYDTLTAAKQLTVITKIFIPTDTTARVRLANFVYSALPVPAIDVFSVKRNENVFTNVQTTQVTDFIPFASALNDTLIVRTTGTTTSLGQLNAFNPTKRRSYTLVFRGRYQSTTGTIARSMTSFVNY